MSLLSEEFVSEMLDGAMLPDFEWKNFDPPFPRKIVSAFERRGWIETRYSGRDAQHRWTDYGRAEHLAGYLRSIGYVVSRPHGLAEKLKALPAADEATTERDGLPVDAGERRCGSHG